MKKEVLDENRLFGNPLNETDIYQVPPVDENGNVHMFSIEQLAAIYKVMKPLLTADELQAFNDMSPEDQEQYLTGFGANIYEWQKAKEAANKPDEDKDDSNMPPMTPPNDGLDHWAPAKKKKSKSQQQQNQQRMNPIFSDIQDELDQIEQETQQAQQSAQQSNDNNSDESNNAQDIANNAQDIAQSAQKMADAAQAAADAAQNAADQADENAQQSGDYKDIKNADKSQVSADAAQDLANQAQEAAERAQQLAKDAQQAAEDGNLAEAERKAKEAYDAAQEAYNKTCAAKANAKDALNSSKQTDAAQNQQKRQGDQQDGQHSNQIDSDNYNEVGNGDNDEEDGDNNQSMQGGQGMPNDGNRNRQLSNQRQHDEDGEDDEATDPTLEKVDNKFDQDAEIIHKRPVNMDMSFDGNDFVANDEELREKCREMAERAGQPLDADDYISPQEYATKKYQEFKDKLRTWKQHSQPGNAGNPPGYIEEVMDRLFATEIDWRDLVKDFMTDKSPGNIIDVWSKRRMGLPDTHPFHKGRYLHPYEDVEEKRSGIAQVFFLVDASGSMGVTAGDGRNIFEHIMSELIQIELQVKIKRSAYATFNAGPIYRDDIFTWTYKDAMDEDDLMQQFRLPIASGGTSAIEGIRSIQEYDDIYSTDTPWTLLIVVTDGGDYYSGLKDICKDPEQVDHMLWIITAEGEKWFKSKTKELVEQGVAKDHIICVDINKEWGVDQEMVKKHNR